MKIKPSYLMTPIEEKELKTLSHRYDQLFTDKIILENKREKQLADLNKTLNDIGEKTRELVFVDGLRHEIVSGHWDIRYKKKNQSIITNK